MPTILYLVWRLEIVNQHTQFGYQEISVTENMRYLKIQLNLHSDLDLENNIIFTQNIQAYDDVPSN